MKHLEAFTELIFYQVNLCAVKSCENTWESSCSLVKKPLLRVSFVSNDEVIFDDVFVHRKRDISKAVHES